jgi:5'-AMP-activated protein kinase catalytic alpha subunit
MTSKLVVVEVKKKGEYREFCNRELKPGLQKLMQE